VLFDRFKFRANTKNFHSPANSMINAVLESKRGNPISLSSLYLIISQKLGLPIYGVNLPNLFILTYKSDQVQFYINTFNRGLIFSKDDIVNYIEHLQLPLKDEYFMPCSHYDIAVRFLRNLIVSFEKLGEYQKSDEVKTLLQAIGESYLE
ncbi:MAG: transglutaminase-like domain-containing protein, partial [Bacteroidota bacterium]